MVLKTNIINVIIEVLRICINQKLKFCGYLSLSYESCESVNDSNKFFQNLFMNVNLYNFYCYRNFELDLRQLHSQQQQRKISMGTRLRQNVIEEHNRVLEIKLHQLRMVLYQIEDSEKKLKKVSLILFYFLKTVFFKTQNVFKT